MNKLFVFLLVMTLSGAIKAQSFRTALNQFLDSELNKFNIPDLEVLVVNKDTVLYKKSIGQSTPNSSYYIGSVSKSLTAYGILRLINQGKLSFNTTVKSILPEIEFTNGGNNLTIQHLLNHTSGIKKSQGFENLPSLAALEQANYSINNHEVEPLKHEYSNLNYALLGLIVEKVTTLSFGEFMQKEVFNPLKMEHSIIGTRSEVSSKLIDHYQYYGPFPVKSKQLNFSKTSIPAGFICSSAMDLGNYLSMNLNGLFQQKKLIDTKLLQSMHTVWNGGDYGYAMGWKQGQYNGKKFYQHLGSTAISYSGIFFIPEQDLGFVLLSNSNSLDFSEQLAAGVLNILTEGAPTTVSRYEHFLRIGVLLGYLILMLNFTWKVLKIYKEESIFTKKKTLTDLTIYSLLLIGVIYFFPLIAQIPFLSFLKIQPDIGILILLSAILPMILAIIKVLKAK